jgi:hypothetical protein
MVSQSNPPLALFLGAGFSKHWGLPLASDVMDMVVIWIVLFIYTIVWLPP